MESRRCKLTDKLLVDVVPEGLMLVCFDNAEEEVCDAFQIGVSWQSVKRLLRDLKYGNTFENTDRSLRVWKSKDRLKFLFRSLTHPIEVIHELTDEETSQFLDLISSELSAIEALETKGPVL